MNTAEKELQLRKYKFFATGLFVLMAVIFVAMTMLQKQNSAVWIGYVRAFSEAAMVGALADWFAVTALFHHPLGLKIPHTNLIEKSKERIGDNLGEFVVSNFLSPVNIRPYMEKLKVSDFAGEWLSKKQHQQMAVQELSAVVKDILNKLNDEEVVNFIAAKAREMTANLKINVMMGSGMEYILHKNDHQKMITGLAKQIKEYVAQNSEMIKERVKRESYFLVPKFVDNTIAEKITEGLAGFFEEVEADAEHSLRHEITQKLYAFSTEIREDKKWEEQLQTIKNDFLTGEKLNSYANDIWQSVKNAVLHELDAEESALKKYLTKNLVDLSQNLRTDLTLKQKIDGWVRHTAYKYILRNTHQAGNLISTTVGTWEGRELSQKLELEVGKDLQFIRVNGTLVGGLVGLLIYSAVHLFS